MARPATDLRARVLRAARAAFAADGFDGTSLRASARSAHTTIGMIYYYFPTKDALWDAVIDDVYQRFLRDIAAVMGAPGPLRDRLAEMARHLAALGDDDRTVIRLAMRDALVSSERRARLFARFQHGHIPLVLGAVARAQATGEVTDAPLAMIAFACGATLLAGQLLLGNLPLPGLPAAKARTYIPLALLFDGIGGAAARPRRTAQRAAISATARGGRRRAARPGPARDDRPGPPRRRRG
jgi:AcrR family transcriptional regulator